MSLSLRFDRALILAADVHRQQVRTGTSIPYIAHLMAVTAIVLEHGGSEDHAIAALLHDAVEDGGGPALLDRIRQEFGPRVAEIVSGCTDTEETPKPPWRARKEAYLAHLPSVSDDTLLVSMADKLHNVRAIATDFATGGESVWTRFNAGRDDILWYYRSLVNEFRKRTAGALLDQLDAAVTGLEHAAGARWV
jgi:(p)ppGpp synthase/HD superfamily hydrolase